MNRLIKYSFIIAFIIGVTFQGYSQVGVGLVTSHETYGQEISADGAITVEDLLAQLENNDVISSVKVTARVDEVCQTKGCWMALQVGDGETMRVVFKDYGFFVPKNMGGKTVVVEGKAERKLISVADLQHLAEDAGKSQEEIEAITEPEVELRFEAIGVIVK